MKAHKTDHAYFQELSELRSRISNLRLIEDDFTFFTEVARLTNWVKQNINFYEPSEYLDKQEANKNVFLALDLQLIYYESLTIWGSIKSQKIHYEEVSKLASESYLKLTQMFNNHESFYALNFYHEIRHLVEELAQSKYEKVVRPYYAQHIETKTPLIAGKIYAYFLDFNKRDDEWKISVEHTDWGAWYKLKDINRLYNREDNIFQLKEWAKVFKKLEYLIYFNRLSDFFYDFNTGNYLIKDSFIEPTMEPVWESSFKVENNTLSLGRYGSIKFEPSKSPIISMGQTIEIGQVEQFIQQIVLSGKNGLSLSELKSALGYDPSTMASYRSHFNDRLDKAFKNGEILAKVQVLNTGPRGKKIARLIVLPKTFTPPENKQA